MKIKINNKINIIPIVLYLLWVIYVEYFFFFKIDGFAKQSPCGAGYMMIGLPIFTIIFFFLALLLMAIVNFISKQKYSTDYDFIVIPFLILIMTFILTVTLKANL